MNSGEMLFRWALPEDIERIWDLLHASYLSWGYEEIGNKLKYMRLLIQGETMTGLYYYRPGETRRLIVHPLYAEALTKEIIERIVSALDNIQKPTEDIGCDEKSPLNYATVFIR